MPTSALTITPTWTKAADGPTNVLLAAPVGLRWAITTGAAPALSADIAHINRANEPLSMQLIAGESLFVSCQGSVSTVVTTGA